MSDRSRGRQLERVPTEVLDPQPEAWARPTHTGTGQEVEPYIAVVREIVREVPAQAEPEPSIRWDRLACYVAGLVMLAVVIVLLMASGALDLRASGPELQPVRQRPVDLVGPSR